MALTPSASCSLMSQKRRPVCSLLAGRVLKKAKCGPPLQEAALRLLQQNQSVEDLLTENLNAPGGSVQCHFNPSDVCASLLISELKREAERRNVSLTSLTVAVLARRLKELTTDSKDELLPASCRAQLYGLLESSRELLSQGALCRELLWKELSRDETFPKLDVAVSLHSHDVIPLYHVLESHGAKPWLVSELKALCCWTPSEAEGKHEQHRILLLVLQVLVGAGFDPGPEDMPQNKRLSALCCSILDHMLFWLLEMIEQSETSSVSEAGGQIWIELFDTTLCGALVSPEALKRYFTHCLTKTLTFKPRLTVSSAITLQNKWTFAKTNPLLTNLFCQLTVVFSMQQLFDALQQILSTHEVNWRHVLGFLSAVLVYNPSAQTSLAELLNVLLSAAFRSYDLESVITAFLLARQGALEGPAVCPSYTDWFKKCFGGSSSLHAASKKALVFLLKFLSDLVPFDPPQYLKVHILHPPFVPMKHRSLLLEYVSLAKTRLADLKESMEDMGLYEDVSAAPAGQSQEAQDVEKAVSLFESSGRISATVMEASIFRRPYFLTRFLPELLTPRPLPVKADARMKFIEALKKADKIPAAQYSSYAASCRKEKRTDPDPRDGPVDVLRLQLDTFRELVLKGDERELLAQVSRMSHTLSVLCPPVSHQAAAALLRTDSPPPDLHVQVASLTLRSFCQCVLDTSRGELPTKTISWASRFVMALAENRQLFSSLLHRLWDLFHNQASSLSAAHVLGLAVLVVELHSSPLMEPRPAASGSERVTEALGSAFRWHTRSHMISCVRFCVVAVCYGLQREDLGPDQLISTSVYKKLLYLIPRLLPGARAFLVDDSGGDAASSWKIAADDSGSWSDPALRLWRDPAFQSLQLKPEYQLSFSEWLHHELQVCRGEDALSDPERQEYHQWACMEQFLPRPEQEGGCGGDTRTLCRQLINAVLNNNEENKDNHKGSGSCLPDVLSRLQECVYELSLAERSGAASHRGGVGPMLVELLSQRLSPTAAERPDIGSELLLQRTLRSWNRVMLALPAQLLVPVTHEAARSTVDCSLLVEHINQHQRAVCCAASLLPCHVATHFVKLSVIQDSKRKEASSQGSVLTPESSKGSVLTLKKLLREEAKRLLLNQPSPICVRVECQGLLCVSARCACPSGEFSAAWTQISQRCPLLLASTVFWWEHMSAILPSLWRRSCDEASLPDPLRLLSDCRLWAHRVLREQGSPAPSAPPLLLAASLYRAAQDGERDSYGYISTLRQEHETPEVLVVLFSLWVHRYLSSLLHPEENGARSFGMCSALLHEIVSSADWLSIFKSTERGVDQPVAMMVSDELNKLMPWAFYSLMCQQSSELLHTATRCPGFIHTAVLCYVHLLQLFIEGHTPTQASSQVEPSQIVAKSKTLLLSCISEMSGSALSSSKCTQLQEVCAELDPEVTAALSHHQHLYLSPEMDFL